MKSFLMILVAIFLASFMFLNVPEVYCQSNSSSEQILVDTKDLPADVVAQIKAKQKVESVGKWVGMGKEIGEAMNGAMTALEEHVDKIGNTRVGKFTMFLVAYKVIGTDMIQLLIGLPLLIIGTMIFIITWFRSCVKRKVKKITYAAVGDKKVISETSETLENPDYDYCWASVVVYAIFLGICTAIIFT
ncbi:MAG: hypothetical protein Q7S33_02465 [Nanoarchaeota archaeon]|nr:hypothetical protein [Nanoarchaeota archaeon]